MCEQSATKWAIDVMLHFAGGEKATMVLLHWLAEVRCPTLVLGGEQDPVCPIRDQAEIADAIPDRWAQFERFADCGHGMFRDHPERAFALLREFIADG